MSRSPFAYPLQRNIDGDAGGAADLQTDIMRFMAILALCLMAIFALVQSMPLAPVASPQPQPQPQPVATRAAAELPESSQDAAPAPIQAPAPTPTPVALTRPQPQPTAPAPRQETASEPLPPAAPAQQDGFTLRFESDLALMRLVATSQVGVYALSEDRAKRMTVSASRISFWDASIPNSFHEMEAQTVPGAVVDALQRSGTPVDAVSWGVTLPGRLRSQLDELMRDNTGGSLLIGADGKLRLEAS